MGIYYILNDDNRPVAINDGFEWSEWFGENYEKRVIKQTSVKSIFVSTVFLGINHKFIGSGPPLLFETIAFGDVSGDTDRMERYSTIEEALEGHDRMVKKYQE